MASRRVLLICYYFPPMGGAGVGRPLALHKYLPGFGVDCDVLTVKSVAYRHFEPELLEGVDTSRIYRAGSLDPQRLMYLVGMRRIKDSTIGRGKKLSDRFFPDPKIGWVRPAVKLGRVLAENRRYDCVISTSPPMSSHLAARTIAREFNLPWIADFRDFWTGYKAEDWFDSERRISRARGLISDITASATTVTVVNPAISDYLGTGELIYNSFDEQRAKLWKKPSPGDHLSIGVLGTIDDLRPLEPLFQVLDHVRRKAPEVFSRLQLLQVGTVNLEDPGGLIGKYDLGDRCDLRGPQNRERTIGILSESSIMYIGLASPHGDGVLPGRIFDMIASGRPILAAAAHGSVVRQLLGEIGNGFCFARSELESAAHYVIEKAEAFRRGEQIVDTSATYAEAFTSSKMAEKFAGIIERIVSLNPQP